eukprot:Gregarina_sp_Poly_1__4917@NODE_2608_length_1924_cov_30_945073_g1652_i0_p1_GENE_NODE_2608_length_1924_cov_30_945073_g1652_i0NODE_2608_length_1924_cov_30_945073_g1652_i0_p1_ORF_typecomplete_len202_score10_49_NODE_2608_length_1924_cov_30_945073_g1652_i011301735
MLSRCHIIYGKVFGTTKVSRHHTIQAANGSLEAVHQHLNWSMETLGSLASWTTQEIIDVALQAYRPTPHIATHVTPFYLTTGGGITLRTMQPWREYRDTFGNKMTVLREFRQEFTLKFLRNVFQRDEDLESVLRRNALEIGDLLLVAPELARNEDPHKNHNEGKSCIVEELLACRGGTRRQKLNFRVYRGPSILRSGQSPN